MKRDLSQPFYGRVECGSPILGLDFPSLMRGYLSLYLYENYDGLYMIYMVGISLVFMSLLYWLFTCFMTTTMCGFHHGFTCN